MKNLYILVLFFLFSKGFSQSTLLSNSYSDNFSGTISDANRTYTSGNSVSLSASSGKLNCNVSEFNNFTSFGPMFTAGKSLDLSNISDQKMSFTINSTTDISLSILMLSVSGSDTLISNYCNDTFINVPGDNMDHQKSIIFDFTGYCANPSFGPSKIIAVYFQVNSSKATSGTITIDNLSIGNIVTLAANDNCNNAISLTPSITCNNIQGDVSNATETQSACAGNVSNDVWFSFDALSFYEYTISVSGSGDFDPVVDLFYGSCDTNSSNCTNLTGTGGTEIIDHITYPNGGNIYVRVYNFGTGVPSTTTFNICVTRKPVNDDCSNAQFIFDYLTDGKVSDIMQSTLSGCSGNADDDVWFAFKPSDVNQIISVQGVSSSLDPVFELFSICGSSPLHCENSNGAGAQEAFTATNLDTSNTYYLRVYDAGTGIPTDLDFSIFIDAPNNDDCDFAASLNINSESNCKDGAIDFSASASSQASCIGTPGPDKWYAVVVPPSGKLIIQVIPTDFSTSFDPMFEIFDDCNNNFIQCFQNSFTGEPEIALVTLTPNKKYYIRVYDSGGQYYPNGPNGGGNYTICVIEPPTNDECSKATFVPNQTSTCSQTTQGTFYGANPSSNNGCYSYENDVWFKFKAITTQTNIKVSNYNEDLAIEIFDGCDGNKITACQSFSSTDLQQISLTNCQPGQEYLIRLYQLTDYPKNFNFGVCISTPIPPNTTCSSAQYLNTDLNYCQSFVQGSVEGSFLGTGGCAGDANDEVWYSFYTISDPQIINISPSGPYFNPVIELWEGCSSSPQLIKCLNDHGDGEDEELTITGISQGFYYLRVYDFDSDTAATTDFYICNYGYNNDECLGADELNIVDDFTQCFYQAVNTTNATTSYNPIFCSLSSVDDDVWYKFTATSTTVTVKAIEMSTGLTGVGMALYENSCSGSQRPECESSAPGQQLTFNNLTVGTTYYLRIFTSGNSMKGSFNICAFNGTPTGINDQLESMFKLFPNPANAKLIIDINKPDIESLSIKLINLEGEKVYESNLTNPTSLEINTMDIPEGFYFVQIKINNNTPIINKISIVH